MDPDLKKLSLGQDKIIENLLNIIRTVGYSSHYVQQACTSNLLVTVFAVLPSCSQPAKPNGQTARHLANTAP